MCPNDVIIQVTSRDVIDPGVTTIKHGDDVITRVTSYDVIIFGVTSYGPMTSRDVSTTS